LRVANRDALETTLSGITLTKTTQEWLDVLEGCGMPYAAINDVKDSLEHKHAQARNMVVEVEHGSCGPMKLVNTPVKFSGCDPGVRLPPPTLGQHTEEVLRELCGMDEEEVGRLKKEGVVA